MAVLHTSKPDTPAIAVLAAYEQQLADAAPPLTERQRDRLAVLGGTNAS
jgi:hypothetical protein